MSCCQKNISSSNSPSTIDHHVQTSTLNMTSGINQWNMDFEENETTEGKYGYFN